MSVKENKVNEARIMSQEDESFIKALFYSHIYVLPMVFKAVIELNLFDIIGQAGDGAYISPVEIASKLSTPSPNAPFVIDRMLRLLATQGLLSCNLQKLEDGRFERLYGLTPTSKLFLKSTDDGSTFVSMFTVAGHKDLMKIWVNLKDAVLEGGNHFKRVHGMDIFHRMKKDPTLGEPFNWAMAGISNANMEKVISTYKGFEGLTSLLDVGGGIGSCLNMIISNYPSIRGINFDLPHVVQTAPTYDQNIEHVGGSMFVTIPKADAIFLKTVLHDWSDEECLKVLRNCYEALPEKGKVIVMEYVMPEAPDTSISSQHASMLDTVMITLLGGQERTSLEYEALCKASGFSDFRVACYLYGHLLAVMEFLK